MILDNLGLLLTGIFRPPTTANGQVDGLKNTSGVVFPTRIYGSDGDNNRWNKSGSLCQVQVGKGSSPVTRQDFKIETPFPDAPESVLNTCVTGVYNSGLGKINQATLISTTGGAGTITEVIKIFRGRSLTDGGDKIVAMFRDIISPVNFIISESINIDHEVLI